MNNQDISIIPYIILILLIITIICIITSLILNIRKWKQLFIALCAFIYFYFRDIFANFLSGLYSSLYGDNISSQTLMTSANNSSKSNNWLGTIIASNGYTELATLICFIIITFVIYLFFNRRKSDK